MRSRETPLTHRLWRTTTGRSLRSLRLPANIFSLFSASNLPSRKQIAQHRRIRVVRQDEGRRKSGTSEARMKVHSVILNSSVLLAFFAAGCACDRVPVATQAEVKRPTARQSAAQKFVTTTPLETQPVRRAPDTIEETYQLEGPAPPVVRASAVDQGPTFPVSDVVATPPTRRTERVAKEASNSPALKRVRVRPIDGRVLSTVDGRSGAAPASKAAKTSGEDVMGIS
jgi:hypothetical protein